MKGESFSYGGEIDKLIEQGIIELKMYDTTPEHAKEYGFESKKPLYIQVISISEGHRQKGIGKKLLKYIDSYAIKNGNDVMFGHISKQAEPSIDIIKSMLNKAGFITIERNNDFYKLVGKPNVRYNEGGKLSSLKSLEELDYELRYPKENKLLFLDADKLLKRHSIDSPSFDITVKENQIGNRVQKAKDYISDYLLDNRWINPKTNERTNIKVNFEPSVVGIYNGKLGFEDGRHRVLAAKELGFKKVAVEVPKGQVAEFEKYFK